MEKQVANLGLEPYLQIAINKPVGFKVVIIFTKRIYELLSHLRPQKTDHS